MKVPYHAESKSSLSWDSKLSPVSHNIQNPTSPQRSNLQALNSVGRSFHIIALVAMKQAREVPSGETVRERAVIIEPEHLVRVIPSLILDSHGRIEQALCLCEQAPGPMSAVLSLDVV